MITWFICIPTYFSFFSTIPLGQFVLTSKLKHYQIDVNDEIFITSVQISIVYHFIYFTHWCGIHNHLTNTKRNKMQ